MSEVKLFPGDADYPRNAWYVAATSDQVTRDSMHRKVVDRDLVFYRTMDGAPVALLDRCPHRGYPLSEGVLVRDNIQCGYHGLQFGPDGKCQVVPSGDSRPGRIRVPRIPVVERWQWIWVWAGEPADADESLIPDLSVYGFDDEDWYSKQGIQLDAAANYLLFVENFLDATHITFLHDGQIDTGDVASEPLVLSESDGRIFGRRTVRDEEQAPMTMAAFGFAGGKAHRTITTEAWPPALCAVQVKFEESGARAGNEQTLQLIVAVTPVDRDHSMLLTATTQTFPFPPGIEQRNDTRNLLTEDAVALEKIQALFDSTDRKSCVEYGLPSDKAAYRARQILTRMIQIERGQISPDVAEADDRLSATLQVNTPV